MNSYQSGQYHQQRLARRPRAARRPTSCRTWRTNLRRHPQGL